MLDAKQEHSIQSRSPISKSPPPSHSPCRYDKYLPRLFFTVVYLIQTSLFSNILFLTPLLARLNHLRIRLLLKRPMLNLFPPNPSEYPLPLSLIPNIPILSFLLLVWLSWTSWSQRTVSLLIAFNSF